MTYVPYLLFMGTYNSNQWHKSVQTNGGTDALNINMALIECSLINCLCGWKFGFVALLYVLRDIHVSSSDRT